MRFTIFKAFLAFLTFTLLISLMSEQVFAKSIVASSRSKSTKTESKKLKKQGKKIRKRFANKMEQIYLSMCTDCYQRMQEALNQCTSVYEKLNVTEDKRKKCKNVAQLKRSKKSKKANKNELASHTDLKSLSWKQLYEDEQKTLSCLLKEHTTSKKYENMSKEEISREKNSLMQQLLQEKLDCMSKSLKI